MAEEEEKSYSCQEHQRRQERREETWFFQRIGKWFRELKSELKKVVWPTPKQLATNTGVALFVMALAAVVLWGLTSWQVWSLTSSSSWRVSGHGRGRKMVCDPYLFRL